MSSKPCHFAFKSVTRKELLREASCRRRRPDTQAAATAKLHFRTPYDSTSELVLRQYSPRSKKIYGFLSIFRRHSRHRFCLPAQFQFKLLKQVEKARDREGKIFMSMIQKFILRLTVTDQRERERSEWPPMHHLSLEIYLSR